jgi:hypothetical protein
MQLSADLRLGVSGPILLDEEIDWGHRGVALANLTRVQATGVIIVLAILWWGGWPWFLQRRDHRLAILRSLAAARRTKRPWPTCSGTVGTFRYTNPTRIHCPPRRALSAANTQECG